MAGIGFELRKVIGRGSLTTFFNAALSGVIIVAGPWLLTILTIFLLNQYISFAVLESPGLFQAVIVYCFAASLMVFSGLHYLFTRIIADMIWEDKRELAAAYLLRFSWATVLTAGLLAGGLVFPLPLDQIAHPWIFKASAVLFFIAINLIWLQMLFISLLKWYVKILLSYAAGLAAALVLVFFLGTRLGVAGALLGFALGHFCIVAILYGLSFSAFSPRGQTPEKGLAWKYFTKFKLLIFSGVFFYLSQWIDKVFYWVFRGVSMDGTVLQLYDQYDIPIYIANLITIPGLVYFVIYCETGFYFSLIQFLTALTKKPYAEIQRRKYSLIHTLTKELRDQSLFQLLFSGAFIIIADLLTADTRSAEVLRIAVAGSYFQLVLMTIMNFLYYFELYKQTLITALGFFLLNAGFTAGLEWLFPGVWPGLGFLLAAIGGCFSGGFLLFYSVRTIDRRIFLKSALL